MNKFSDNPGIPINTFILPFVFTDKVKEAVESIWKCHNPAEHRLILVDNASHDSVDKHWLRENSHLYISSYRNLGPALAFNLGIQIARTDYVTIISDDARLIYKDWFKQSIDLIEKDPESPIVSLGSIYPQSADIGDFYDSGKIYTADDYSNYCRKYEMKRDGFGLACAIGKKSTWLLSGLFDESKYIYTIDGTFASKANLNGIKTVYNGVVFHYGDASYKGKLVEEGKFHQVGLDKGIIQI